MSRILPVTLALCFALWCLRGEGLPSFEVAPIKPFDRAGQVGHGSVAVSGPRVTFTGYTLSALILYAYFTHHWQAAALTVKGKKVKLKETTFYSSPTNYRLRTEISEGDPLRQSGHKLAQAASSTRGEMIAWTNFMQGSKLKAAEPLRHEAQLVFMML